MKVLINASKTKQKPAPKWSLKFCMHCGSLLFIKREDCYEAENVLDEPVWAADCAACGTAFRVADRCR